MTRWLFCLFLLLVLDIDTISAAKAKIQSLDESSTSKGALGQGFQIHKMDLLTKQLQATGAKIFENLDHKKCTKTDKLGSTSKDETFFSDTESLYSSISTNNKIDASIKGPYTLGVSVSAVTNSIASANKEVSGLSLNLKAASLSHELKRDCMSEEPLSEQFIKDFEALNMKIDNPWKTQSWRRYKAFLEKYGSHIVKSVTAGSSIYQYVFAESSKKFSQRDFTVKACVSLAGPSQVGEVGVSACSEVSKKDIESSSKMSMVKKLVVRGGTAKTRADLTDELSKEQINKFLQEGETDPSPIQYKFYPIWKLLETRYIGKDDFAKVINLEQYYKGFLNFGCYYEKSTNGKVVMQKFDIGEESEPDAPTYVCKLGPEGCHDNDDCHYEHAWWCSCSGESCIRYKRQKESSGETKKVAYAETSRSWGWHGCTGGSKYWCTCTDPKTKEQEAWTGDSPLKDVHLMLLKKNRDEAAKRKRIDQGK